MSGKGRWWPCLIGKHGGGARGVHKGYTWPCSPRPGGPARGTRSCLGCHLGTRHGTGAARSNDRPGSGPIKINY
jgi:hypothetical protein